MDSFVENLLNQKVEHLENQVKYWKKRAEVAEQENKELYHEFVCGEDEQ
jgi:hypothetical protein